VLPLIQELADVPEPTAVLRRFADIPLPILFDSAAHREDRLGRYSYFVADPWTLEVVDHCEYGRDPFRRLRDEWSRFQTQISPSSEVPPFQGGAAGLLSYELGGAWERIPRAAQDEFGLPDLVAGLYDWCIAWDHHAGRAWIVSQGFPETTSAGRNARARDRLRFVQDRLNAAPEAPGLPAPTADRSIDSVFGVPVSGRGVELLSDFAPDEYLAAVARSVEYIRAGDIFQVNLSQRLLARWGATAVELYERLRRVNPAPFAGYLAHDDWAVVSASPERFLSVQDGWVTTRPIKGTRRRSPSPEGDLFTRDALRESEKDRAENVMIVDLQRNDLSRVCAPGTVSVPQLCAVETYETVQHLVSEVRGQLRPEQSPWDLFAATFPGGSITGAPKVRAMEIIAELEPTVRGPYCGSLFQIGFDGSCDSSILIRTFVVRGGWAQCSVGGGIVSRSLPDDEYRETWHKAAGMLRALRE
jgi:para-aminobenzoate synthetase component 1